MLECTDCDWCTDMYHNNESKLYCYKHRCVVFKDKEVCDCFEDVKIKSKDVVETSIIVQ